MKRSLLVFLASAAAALAVDGTVVNRTTGKPEPGATVTLYQLGGAGMQPLDSVRTGAQGRFSISGQAQGPRLVQTIFDGVVYNQMLPPGAPDTGLTLEVYHSSRRGEAAVADHILVLEPAAGQVNVIETFIYRNPGKLTWNDAEGGTVRFWMPEAAKGIARVSATAPGGMPVDREAEKTSRPGVYKVDFPIKPGETRVDIRYMVPLQEDGAFEGKVLYEGQGPTRLVTPAGVSLSGDAIAPMGAEPQTQANIYEVKGTAFRILIQGSGTLAAAPAEDSGPEIEQVMPRVFANVKLILGLAFGILALGFILLYRAQPAPAEGRHGPRRRR